jgi:hypothetical protein
VGGWDNKDYQACKRYNASMAVDLQFGLGGQPFIVCPNA